MTTFTHRLAFATVFTACICSFSNAKPLVIDDKSITNSFVKSMEEFVGTEGVPSAEELSKSVKELKTTKSGIPLPSPPGLAEDTSYKELSRSVFLIASVYKCDNCDNWHQGGSASAWCLGEDGVLVTNAHVFTGAHGGAMGVIDRTGRCYPVIEIIGSDLSKDIAVFRVKAEGLRPLRIGEAAEVGSPVTVISNPSGNYFLRTSGDVARYSKGAGMVKNGTATWMSITADYAQGSSGGPVFNAAGEVVGMVSSTRSIYTKPKKKADGQLQMVIKSCVPGGSIRDLFPITDTKVGN
ncbi:MAG: trypsin-like peptidase domain-containing protein [Verrucomicrobia bacterium]|jgi:S1-C subfamily serine protease|nr:trypsin-like peptidase domain-containing protein [Verrucomicrobiota bacterium]|tara:strand:- start:17819 stop:18703 length:885 start_codon:yes stop_codon:yes gene_type:complete